MVKLTARVRYQILRSPLARAIKLAQTWNHRGELRRRARIAHGVVVDDHVASLAGEINGQGHVDLTPIIDPQLLEDVIRAGRAKMDRADRIITEAPAGTSAKAFWDRLLDDELVDGRLPASSPFARFALQPRLLALLTRAMGGLPQLDYVLLTLSHPTDAPLAQSQLWHRDHDDTRTIKVFAYLTDVSGAEDGPFTFIPGPASDRVGFTLRSHLPDERMFSRIPRIAASSIIAPAGSVFAVETSRCLHMGSRVTPGHRRLLYTATYTSFPKLIGKPPRGFALVGTDASEIERAVLAPGEA